MSSSSSQPTVVPSLAARVRRRARRNTLEATQRVHRDLLRATRNPFTSRADRPLIVHCGYHKAGTVWFREVLSSVVRPYGLRFQEVKKEPIRSDTDIAFCADSRDYRNDLLGHRLFRGSHMVRDPRDLVVSGYEYHLVTEEAWAHQPRPAYRGMSYQAYLHSLSEHDGLMAEIEWVAKFTARLMTAWDYGQPEYLELRYEEALADEQGTFQKVFQWYGFNEIATSIGLEAVDRLSLKRGGAIPNHVRSGAPGEWRTRLAPEHIARFKELTGDLTIRLGYETAPDW